MASLPFHAHSTVWPIWVSIVLTTTAPMRRHSSAASGVARPPTPPRARSMAAKTAEAVRLDPAAGLASSSKRALSLFSE